MFVLDLKPTLSMQLSGKVLNILKEERYKELHQPLLQDYQFQNEELLALLSGYLVYLVHKNDENSIYCGFLATKKKIVIPIVPAKSPKSYIVYVHNRDTQKYEDYNFVIKSNTFDEDEEVVIAEVSDPAQNINYPDESSEKGLNPNKFEASQNLFLNNSESFRTNPKNVLYRV